MLTRHLVCDFVADIDLSKIYVMKKIMFVIIVLLGLSLVKADAQYVKRKPVFSINLSVGAPGPPPYREAIWIEPQWRWRNGRYVEVAGHWAKAPRRGSTWVAGRWAYTNRRGYRWHNGYWK